VWDEESGELHRQLEGFPGGQVEALATFLSPDGQQPRLVAGSYGGTLLVYDPEAGSVLHYLEGHADAITDLACIASSSAAPHHPRVVSGSDDGFAKVWDGETGEWLAELRGEGSQMMAVAVWKEHTGGHDRIATSDRHGRVKVFDGEAFTLLHDLDCNSHHHLLAFKSAEGPTRLLVALAYEQRLQVWDPEEGPLLHGISSSYPVDDFHLLESAQGRHLLAILSRHPRDTNTIFLDVWDLGEAPAPTGHLRRANKQG
jgi:WD40 repeat protein